MVADGFLDKGVGEEEGVDDHEAEAGDGVEPEAEDGKRDDGHGKDEEEKEPKLGVRSKVVLLL